MKEIIEMLQVLRGKRLFTSKQEEKVQQIVDEAIEFHQKERKKDFFLKAFGVKID